MQISSLSPEGSYQLLKNATYKSFFEVAYELKSLFCYQLVTQDSYKAHKILNHVIGTYEYKWIEYAN